MRIGFIGVGNMATALIYGMNTSLNEFVISIYDKDLAKANLLKDVVTDVCISEIELLNRIDILVLSIKPDNYEDFLQRNITTLKDITLISLAPGMSSEYFSRFTSNFVLTMPNTPAKIGLGLTSIVRNQNITTSVMTHIELIFQSVGEIVYINEVDLPLLIALAGSSPAYFGLVIDAMVKYATDKGMHKSQAYHIISNVMNSTSKMHLLENEESPRILVDRVCSKNGTTIEAVNYFDENGLDELFYEALDKCSNKALKMKV